MSESSRTSIQMGKVHKLFADVEEMLDDMRDHFQNQVRVLQQNLTRPKVPHNNPIQIQENIWAKPQEANEFNNVWTQNEGLDTVIDSPNHEDHEAPQKNISSNNAKTDSNQENELENESDEDGRKVL